MDGFVAELLYSPLRDWSFTAFKTTNSPHEEPSAGICRLPGSQLSHLTSHQAPFANTCYLIHEEQLPGPSVLSRPHCYQQALASLMPAQARTSLFTKLPGWSWSSLVIKTLENPSLLLYGGPHQKQAVCSQTWCCSLLWEPGEGSGSQLTVQLHPPQGTTCTCRCCCDAEQCQAEDRAHWQ